MTSPEPNNRANRLISEKSPYLLQHAHNPVDWYPWGDEAFETARKLNRPVFLSIGYSTCHWCHVMERESFEDPSVAKLMNEAFINVKVDREERPDIDSIYMTICQLLTGGGGWPLSIIMTPDKKPFYAATYIPKESGSGRVGMLDLIPRIEELWKTQRGKIDVVIDQSITALRQFHQEAASSEISDAVFEMASSQLGATFDEENGGFGAAPKFPTPHNLTFLLRYWRRTGEIKARDMIVKTLDAMSNGGIYDHIGFGFHRYSTDEKWLVPHFEKMLYDQALIAMAYTEAYQAFRNEKYKDKAKEIFTYLLRDMLDKGGGFYSAEDADSEGVEGKFYLWSEDEIRRLLNTQEADLFIKIFNIEKDGNFTEECSGRKTGANIPHLSEGNSRAGAETLQIIESARQKLYNARSKRIRPHKDDKILTDWNGLTIAALAKAAQAFDEPLYADSAARAVEFILRDMRHESGALYHRYRAGEKAIKGFLDDYAFFTWGLLELYEATFKVKYLQKALELNKYLIEHFWDEANGGFFLTAENAENLILRTKESFDGAAPSGNSVAALNMMRIARITADVSLESKALQISRAFSNKVSQLPTAHLQMIIALDFIKGPSYEIVIVGGAKADDTKILLCSVRTIFSPNKVVILRPIDEEWPEISQIARYTEVMTGINDKATAYVCMDHSCKLPTNDPSQMVALLQGKA